MHLATVEAVLTQCAGVRSENHLDAFLSSFSVIIFSELGDKTFFVAAIMAMRYSRVVVFLAAAIALLAMTLLSALLGSLATVLIPTRVTVYLGCLLMYAFGLKMLCEARRMTPDHARDEIGEVNEEIRKRQYDAKTIPLSVSTESGQCRSTWRSFCAGLYRLLALILSGPFFQTMMMVFIGEWGDRSQLSTIILASHKNIVAVSAGAFIGHCLCTGLAVLCGQLLSTTVSVRTVTIIGAITFFVFGTASLVTEISADFTIGGI